MGKLEFEVYLLLLGVSGSFIFRSTVDFPTLENLLPVYVLKDNLNHECLLQHLNSLMIPDSIIQGCD